MAWLPPSATTTKALFHWGHRVCHANSEAPAATICRDNHSMPSWSPSPLLTSHAWMCQLLLQHNLNRPKFSVIDSMLIQLSTSWFRKIKHSVKITYLPKCPCFQYMSQSSKVNVKGTRYYINFRTLNLRAYCLMTKSCSPTCIYLEMQFKISSDILRILLYQWSCKKRPWKWFDTCLLAKMSSEASLSSFSWTSLASSLQDSARRSLLLLSTTNITAVTDKITGHRKITFWAK